MSRALIISIGTGIGEGSKPVESLAKAIAFSIDSLNPDTVYFIASKESREKTIPVLLSIKSLNNYEIVEISSPDNIHRTFNEIRPIVEEVRRKNEFLAVDYTSGTKVMTSSLAMLGILYEADRLCNVIGERKNGIVQTGTESLQTVNPQFAIFEKKIQVALSFFNQCQYDSALMVIEEIEKRTKEKEIMERIQKLKTASKAYSEWDKFNHQEAFEYMKDLRDREFDRNKRFLGMLTKIGEPNRSIYYLGDLYNNALRRGDFEKKYDDAVARLYRFIELLAHIQLKRKYGIEPSSAKLNELPETLQKEWQNQSMNGVVKLALQDAYRLLRELDDELGRLTESPKMRNLLSTRNQSILAHGLTPICEAVYLRFKEEAYAEALKHMEHLDEIIQDSKFIKLSTI